MGGARVVKGTGRVVTAAEAIRSATYKAQVLSGRWPSDTCAGCRALSGACCQRAWHHHGDFCLHCGNNEAGPGWSFRQL